MVDVKAIKDQLAERGRRSDDNTQPPKVRMTMGGQEYMVLARDVHDYQELGYRMAPADPIEGTKQGEYRPGKYERPKAKAAAAA